MRPRRGEFVHSLAYHAIERELSRTDEGTKLLRDLVAQRGEEGVEEFLLANGREGLVKSGNFSGLRQAMRRDNAVALKAAEA
ncbi:MAG: hypothetical protein AAB478_00265 [Patescibacteria group bacterium]